MRSVKRVGVLMWMLWAGTGCVGGSKGLSSEDKEKLKPYILDAVPNDVKHRIDINFENKVHIVGYKVEPEVASKGTDVKITYYWRVDEALDEGWMLFTHLRDEDADHNDNLDWVGPIREQRGNKQVFGPERWEKGKVIVDEQTYKIPDWVKGPEITVMVGIWKGDARLRVLTGDSDGDNRAIVLKLKTGLERPKAEPVKHTEALPTISVGKLAQADKITIDGKGDEKAWGGAASTGPFVDVSTGEPNTSFPVNGSAKLTWDETNLYALVDVKAADFYTGFTDAKAQPKDFTKAGQPKMWTKDTIELMIDPEGDGDTKDYYEIQIGPQNKVFKSHFDTLQQPNGGPDGPFGHEDWDPKMKSAVSITKNGDKNAGYVVELAIPWAGLHKAPNRPPKHGETWRVNFYAMKDNSGVSWSPILRKGNFHHGPRFGKVTWVNPTAAPAASAAPSASAARIVAAPKAAPPH